MLIHTGSASILSAKVSDSLPMTIDRRLPNAISPRRWPSPTSSPDSARAFLVKSRPSGAECQVLLDAFYELPKSLSPEELLRGLKDILATMQFILTLQRSEDGAHLVRELRKADQNLTRIVDYFVEEHPPAGKLAKDAERRKLDRTSRQYRAAMQTFVVAAAKGLKAPSVRELMALAVTTGIELPTADDTRRHAVWRDRRRRVVRAFARFRTDLVASHKALELGLRLEALDRLKAEADDAEAGRLRALVAAIAEQRSRPNEPGGG
jgi:hypothetical protein